MTKSKFVLMHATASHAGWGDYRRIALVEVRCDDNGKPLIPLKIDPRCKKVVKIVKTWEHLRYGTTARSEYVQALAHAEDLRDLHSRAQKNNLSSGT